MTMTIEATYRKGVFVPVATPVLAEEQRVRLVIEPLPGETKATAFPNGLPRNRIELDPDLAREIALSPEFDLYEP